MANTHARFSILVVSLRFPQKAEPKTKVFIANSLFWEGITGNQNGGLGRIKWSYVYHADHCSGQLGSILLPPSEVLYTVASEISTQVTKEGGHPPVSVSLWVRMATWDKCPRNLNLCMWWTQSPIGIPHWGTRKPLGRKATDIHYHWSQELNGYSCVKLVARTIAGEEMTKSLWGSHKKYPNI